MGYLKKTSFFAFLIIIAAGIIISCRKKENPLPPDETDALVQASAMSLLNDVLTVTDEVLFTGVPGDSCAMVSLDTIPESDTLYIDFASGGCVSADGTIRKGMLKVVFPGSINDTLLNFIIQAESYFMNDQKLDGSVSVIINGYNGLTQFIYSVNFSGYVFLAAGTESYYWEAYLKRNWHEGISTTEFSDNAYLYSGISYWSAGSGHTWGSEIINMLKFSYSCSTHYALLGNEEITDIEQEVMVLDYGAGGCDKSASLMVNGESYEVVLP